MRWTGLRWSLGGVLAAAVAAGPAGAATLAWSTFLRSGPTYTAQTIAELEHDTPLTVLGCDGGWCRVSGSTFAGYVDQGSLILPRTTAPQPPARTDCVVVGQAGNRAPTPTRFCSAAPAAPAPR